MAKVIYYVAASIDGFIADADGSIGWLQPFEESGVDYGYQAFYAPVGAIVMGSKTYMDFFTLGVGWPYRGIETVVMSRRALPTFPQADRLRFAQGDLSTVIDGLKSTLPAGKTLWLLGGGQLAAQCLAAGLLDEIQLSIMPVLLGRGTPLFSAFDGHFRLTLKAQEIFPDGVVQVTYSVR
jgi:dihydrofolate reductase